MREALALSPLIWKIVQNSLGGPEFPGRSSSFQDELGDLFVCQIPQFPSAFLISIIALHHCSLKTILLV